RAGADDYLTKPVTPRALAARLAAHMRRAARDAGAADSDELKANASILAQVSIFFLAPSATVRSLAATGTRLKVDAGQTVVTDRVSNQNLYVIIKGHFRISAESSSGHTMTVAMLGPADFFGATSSLTRRS